MTHCNASDARDSLRSGSYRFPVVMIFFPFLLLSLGCLLLPGAAIANYGGYLEFNYNNSTEETTDQTGETSKTKANNFNQLYNLSLTRAFFPNVFLNTGGTFQKESTRNNIEGDVTRFSVSNLRPYVDLTMRNPLFTLGGNYYRREKREKGTDSPTITNINDKYTMIFGWRPEGLPSTEMRLEKSKLFDRERISQDTATDSLLMAFRYVPDYEHLKGLDVQYRPSYRKIQQKLDDIVTTELAHNARVTFSDAFFNKRMAFYTSYNIAHAETEITRSSTTAEISQMIFPFSGLSAIDDTPAKVVLSLNSALIDGDLTVGAGIDIGLPGLGGNTDRRNIGLDFVVETEVNGFFLWIDRELPSQIVNAFKWDIYTSSDNDNWTFLTTVPVASFGPFQNRFEINFSNVKTRYIKVVTTPLKPGDTIGVPGDFSNIVVTELQAFLKIPSGKFDRRTKDTRTNHIYNLDVRTRILDVPSLYYEFSYFLTKAASSFRNSTISNGLSATHRFSSIVTARARVAREDNLMQDESDVTYLYNASVTAQPLRTLSHTLNYSGQTQEVGKEKSNTNAIFLINSAELYKGINIKIDGGLSVRKKDTGEETTSTTYTLGSVIAPHRRLSMDFYYTNAKTKRSGGDLQDATTFNRIGTVSISYKPFDTVYLFVSFETNETEERTRNLQNYGASWSPFPDGSLQFSLTYNESVTSDEGKTRLINPSARWNINRKTYLDLSSQIYRNESDIQKSDRITSGATLRTVF